MDDRSVRPEPQDGDVGRFVPELNPDRDALLDFGLTAVSAIPVLGGVIADLSRGMLVRKSEERQFEFNVRVAQQIDLMSQAVVGLTPQLIVESDEFMAAYERTARIAAESSSLDKRARLARVLQDLGPWSGLSKGKREYFLRLASEYSDHHILLLMFFREPALWLTRHVAQWDSSGYGSFSGTPFQTRAHPMGGTFSDFWVGNRIFSVLDDQYPYADDFEVHERNPNIAFPDGSYDVIAGTEKRAKSWDGALAVIAGLELIDIDVVLDRHVFPDDAKWRDLIGPAIADLATDGLATIPIGIPTPARELLERRVTPFGDEFLAFLREPNFVTVPGGPSPQG